MKKITIKIALIATLLGSMPSMCSMSRIIVKGLHKPMLQKASSLWITGKRSTEKLLARLQERARNGEIISRKELAEFDSSATFNKHYILNSPDEAGHTLLNYVFKTADSAERRKLLKALYYRGANFNSRDKFVMGSQAWLKANLNLPLEASARRTLKAFRTFMTKNAEDERLNKVVEVKEAYKSIEKDLLAAREKECLQAEIDKQMPAY